MGYVRNIAINKGKVKGKVWPFGGRWVWVDVFIYKEG